MPVSQALATYQPAPGFPQSPPIAGLLGLANYGLQSASFTARRNGTYSAPTGGTIVLPQVLGKNDYLVLTLFGAGVSYLSGTVSSGGVIFSSLPLTGGATYVLCDASLTYGWC